MSTFSCSPGFLALWSTLCFELLPDVVHFHWSVLTTIMQLKSYQCWIKWTDLGCAWSIITLLFIMLFITSPCPGFGIVDKAVERMAFLGRSPINRGKLKNLMVEYNFGWKGLQVHHAENREEWEQQSRHNGLQKSTLQQLRELVSRVPWEDNVKDKGIQETWQLLKETVLKAQSKVFWCEGELGSIARHNVAESGTL